MKKANFEVKIMCKRSITGNRYVMLAAGLGYRDLALTFDKATISELTGVDVGTINQLNVDEVIPVGAIKVGE